MSDVFFSPAKVNLFFRLLHRRSDGFHEIASLYQAVSLGDIMYVSIGENDTLTCEDPKIPCDQNNLIFKALALFRKKTGYAFKVEIHLEKKIPTEAGLGGGSSNAATALYAFNSLSPDPVSDATLREWAAECGSDVPFFFSTGSAYCTGRGEKINVLAPLPSQKYWVAKPQRGLSTPEVYSHCRPEQCAARDPNWFLERAVQGDVEMFNDLEEAAFFLMPSLFLLKKELISLDFSSVSMTGSGTAFLCRGNIEKPQLDGVCFFPISFIHRKIGGWYTPV